METPTRLPVLLHRRKSAFAGCAEAASNSATGTAARMRIREMRRLAAISGGAVTTVVGSKDARFWRDPSRPVNDDSAEVVYVGECRPWHQEVSQGLKESPRIVLREKRGGIEAASHCACHRFAINQRTGGVTGRPAAAIGAIGVACQGSNRRHPRKRDRKR